MKKSVTGLADRVKKADAEVRKELGLKEGDPIRLKLEDVRQKVFGTNETDAPPQAIVVMGPEGVKAIDFRDVWRSGESAGMAGQGQGPVRLRFAGEQQVTSAILALSQKKEDRKTVLFVRYGGPPVTERGPFREFADRLRAFNFNVREKDVSPEAAKEKDKSEPGGNPRNKVWVVYAGISTRQTMPGMEPQPVPFDPAASEALSRSLKEHLDAGGSALCLMSSQISRSPFDPAPALYQGPDLSAALKPFGLQRVGGVLAVHERLAKDTGERPRDLVEQARREPPVFVLNEYADHPITRPLGSLNLAILLVSPVAAIAPVPDEAKDAKVTMLVPLPTEPVTWGERDMASVMEESRLKFDPDAGDVAGPLYAAAAAEKDGRRVVVIGSVFAAADFILRLPDEKLHADQKIDVAQFPANGELMTNSVFWLTGDPKDEKMIGLSPAAMDTSRIRHIDPGWLSFLHVGLLLVGLPALTLVVGGLVYHSRRG